MSKINLPLKKKEEYIRNRKFNNDGDILEKKCSVCNVFKPINEFDINKELNNFLKGEFERKVTK